MVHIISGHPLTATIISSHQKIYQLQYSWKLSSIISPPCCALLIVTLGNALMAGIYTSELVLHPGFIVCTACCQGITVPLSSSYVKHLMSWMWNFGGSSHVKFCSQKKGENWLTSNTQCTNLLHVRTCLIRGSAVVHNQQFVWGKFNLTKGVQWPDESLKLHSSCSCHCIVSHVGMSNLQRNQPWQQQHHWWSHTN
jgi:hypothetical protein